MEARNQDTLEIDEVSTFEMLEMLNREDEKVAIAVKRILPMLAQVVDWAVACIEGGGRLFYMGSGTSGKLAVIDASECPPTFGIEDGVVIALISGGKEAVAGWREDTEDDAVMAIKDLKGQQFSPKDMLIGVSASGTTPYVLSGLTYAYHIGSKAVGLCCSSQHQLANCCDALLCVEVGPEAIMGSTRMKAGTAQKMILNMISSAVMIRLGKTYSNLMVNVRPINKKLQQRVVDIIHLATGKTKEEASAMLEKAEGDTKIAILMSILNIDQGQAQQLLKRHGGILKKAIKGEKQ